MGIWYFVFGVTVGVFCVVGAVVLNGNRRDL